MNELLPPLSLGQPAWLLLLPLPWLLGGYLQRRQRQRLARFIDPRLWPLLVRRESGGRRTTGHRVFAVAWFLALLAASDPRIPDQQPPAPQAPAGPDVVLIIDISPSMDVTDMAPSRLARAKFEAQDFLARRGPGRTALVAFSAQAYPLLPLTWDTATLTHFISSLDSGLTRRHGSNLTMALETAARLLVATGPPHGRAVLLLSDGETHDPDSARGAARRLGIQGIPLLILGVGTPAGGPVRDAHGRFLKMDGRIVISQRADALLGELARLSGGAYVPATHDDSDWHRLFQHLERRGAATASPPAGATTGGGSPLYPWLLAPALLLFLWAGLRRPPVAAAVLLVGMSCLMTAPPAQAAWPWQERQAHKALQAGDYSRAAALYRELGGHRGALGRGVAAYRQGDWEAALAAFREAARLADSPQERAAALYNSGTTMLRLGDWDAAEDALRETLRVQPDHKGAVRNLEVLDQARRLESRRSGERASRTAIARRAGEGPVDTDGGDTALGPAPSAPASPSARAGAALPPSFLAGGAETTTLVLQLRIDAQEQAFGALPETRPW